MRFRKPIYFVVDHLPYPFVSFLIQARESKKRLQDIRKHVKTVAIQEDLELDMYWKAYGIGNGPAIAVYAFQYEVLKFDCYGKRKGHFHISKGNNLNSNSGRILFFEKTKEEQIERVIFELKYNLGKYLALSKNRKIRHLRINQSSLESCLREVRSTLLGYLHHG